MFGVRTKSIISGYRASGWSQEESMLAASASPKVSMYLRSGGLAVSNPSVNESLRNY
jgi:hypothetical protein